MNTKWLDTWHVNATTNKGYDIIDGLRGIAILLVIGCHLIYVNPKAGPLIQFLGAMFGAGSAGVTIFFTLSGFLISSPFWKKKIREDSNVMVAGYGWRRFYKIYPPLATSIILLTPVYIFFSGDWSYAHAAAKWLVGMPIFFPVNGNLNPVMWSLVVEIQFYIFIPLLFISLKRMSAKTCLWVVPLTLFVVGQGSSLIYFMTGIESSIHPNISIRFPAFLDFFTLGVLLAGLECYWKGLPRQLAKLGNVGFILLFSTIITNAWLNFHSIKTSYLEGILLVVLVKIASLFLLCYIANPQALAARLLCQPLLRWCGVISYEWYLFHQPIVIWARASLGPANGNVIRYGFIVGGSFVVSLIVAATFYRYFSLPTLKIGRAKHRSNQVNT